MVCIAGAMLPALPGMAGAAEKDLTQDPAVREQATYTYFARGDAKGAEVKPFSVRFYPGPDLHGAGPTERDGKLIDDGTSAAPVPFASGELTDGKNDGPVAGWVDIERLITGSPTADHPGEFDILFDLGSARKITRIELIYTDAPGRRFSGETQALIAESLAGQEPADSDFKPFASAAPKNTTATGTLTLDGDDVTARYLVIRPRVSVSPARTGGSVGGVLHEVRIFGE